MGPHREAIRVDSELIIVNDEHDNFKRMKECESTDSIVNVIGKKKFADERVWVSVGRFERHSEANDYNAMSSMLV